MVILAMGITLAMIKKNECNNNDNEIYGKNIMKYMVRILKVKTRIDRNKDNIDNDNNGNNNNRNNNNFFRSS